MPPHPLPMNDAGGPARVRPTPGDGRPRSRARRLAFEDLERRTVLSGMPSITLELVPSAQQSFSPVTIPLDSYQFGFQQTVNAIASNNSGAGRVHFDALKATAAPGAATPDLFAAITQATSFAEAILTQFDASGRAVAWWSMSDVSVASDAIGGSGSSPEESISLDFGAVTEATGTATEAWDQTTNSASLSTPNPLPTPPSTPLPAAGATGMELTLQPGGQGPAITIPLDTYRFGFQQTVTIGTSTSGAGIGKVTFQDLAVAAALGPESPMLFQSLAAGTAFASATLTQLDASGAAVAEWSLGDVLLASDSISGGGSTAPEEDLQLAFGTVTEATRMAVRSWDRVTNSAGTPAPTSVPDTLPALAGTGLELTLQPGGKGPAIAISLDSYRFGFQQALSIGTSTSGAGAGRVTFQDLNVATALGPESPMLLQSLAAGAVFASATLTQRDASGAAVVEWSLGDVLLASDSISGGGSTAPAENLQLAFATVTEATSAAVGSWDVATNAAGTPAPTSVPDALPAAGATGMELTLQPGGQGPAITIPLDTYRFGFQQTVTIGTSTSGAGIGKVTFQDLAVSSALLADSPTLLAALCAGQEYPTAYLVQRDAKGEIIDSWAMGIVFLSSGGMAGDLSSHGLPAQNLTLAFGSVTEETVGGGASWNRVYNNDNGDVPSLPAGNLVLVMPQLSVGGTFTYDGAPQPGLVDAIGLDGFSQVPGEFTLYYNGSRRTPTEVGSYSVLAIFRSLDATYSSTSGTFTLVILPATPQFAVGGSFTYDGTSHPLAGTAIGVDGTTPVPGTLSYTYNGSTTPPTDAGTYTVVGTFVSRDSQYASTTETGILVIGQATPTVTVGGTFTYDGTAHPASGTAIGVDGTTPVAGTFRFRYGRSSAPPTLAGTYPFTATFLSNDPNYTGMQVDGMLLVNRATPTIAWADPAGIVYGTPLGPGQLDASASAILDGSRVPVGGTFDYTPTASTILGAGPQELSVTFLPADTWDFNAATATAAIDVTAQATVTSLIATTPDAFQGQTVGFIASVAPTAGGPGPVGGTVEFRDAGTGEVLGITELANGGAVLMTGALGVGPHQVIATFLGSADFSASTSAPVPVVVFPWSFGSGLMVRPGRSVLGAMVPAGPIGVLPTFSARPKGPGAGSSTRSTAS